MYTHSHETGNPTGEQQINRRPALRERFYSIVTAVVVSLCCCGDGLAAAVNAKSGRAAATTTPNPVCV